MQTSRWTDIETFLLGRRDLCPSTAANVLRRLRFMERHGVNLDDPQRGDYDRFIAERKRDRRDGPGIRHYPRALKHFLAFKGIYWPDLKPPRCVSQPAELMPDAVADRLLHYGDGEEDTGWADDMAAAKFSFDLGLYVAPRCPSEPHVLTVDDFDWDHGRLRIYCDKTGLWRVVDLYPFMADIVRDYIDGPRRKLAAPHRRELIARPDGARWSRNGYRMWVSRHGRRVWDRFKPRAQRTWGATWLLIETGFDVYFVKEWLGHVHLKSTEYYLRVAREKVRRRSHAHDVKPFHADPEEG